MTNHSLIKQRIPDPDLVREFKAFLEVRPISTRYIHAGRLALKKYQDQHDARTFNEINYAGLENLLNSTLPLSVYPPMFFGNPCLQP